MTTVERLATLQSILTDIGPVVVAFSGGADSTFLAVAAHRTLGPDRAFAVTAVSPSLAGSEAADCAEIAARHQLVWQTVDTDEMERAAYRRNDPDRCWHCKSALMDALEPLACELGATIVLGVNVDDLGDHRPGQLAAAERHARFPLVEAGCTKADVRAMSRDWGLSTWDKPAAACLASRIPYGTEVSVGVLSRVDRAEAALRQLGVSGSLRVRHHGNTARIEVEPQQFPVLFSQHEVVVAAVRAVGYEEVTVDLEGFRSGRLNDVLVDGRLRGANGS
jgi:pyridinium-3,5-biscarboxylic acid mononucleotide sulfurtransferase